MYVDPASTSASAFPLSTVAVNILNNNNNKNNNNDIINDNDTKEKKFIESLV